LATFQVANLFCASGINRQMSHSEKRAEKRGLVIVNTGDGKGKTTAALGILMRAWGRNLRVGGVQFFKHENASFGELKAAERMGIALTPEGDGFTWTSKDIDATQAKALNGWEIAKRAIIAGQHDVFLLDEFTYVMSFGWLHAADVVDWLRTHKPPLMHVIVTGRDAPQALIDYADVVTEMKLIKHPYRDQNLLAQAGVDF
jgi:cob(I)alamin adenosyltransferase